MSQPMILKEMLMEQQIRITAYNKIQQNKTKHLAFVLFSQQQKQVNVSDSNNQTPLESQENNDKTESMDDKSLTQISPTLNLNVEKKIENVEKKPVFVDDFYHSLNEIPPKITISLKMHGNTDRLKNISIPSLSLNSDTTIKIVSFFISKKIGISYEQACSLLNISLFDFRDRFVTLDKDVKLTEVLLDHWKKKTKLSLLYHL